MSVVEQALRTAHAHPDDLLAVVGPTASGKTALAVELAERLGGEVVSADSVQIYRAFDVGSGKPTPDELARAPHHLVSVLDPMGHVDAALVVVARGCAPSRRCAPAGECPSCAAGRSCGSRRCSTDWRRRRRRAPSTVSSTSGWPSSTVGRRCTNDFARSMRRAPSGCTPTTSSASAAHWRSSSSPGAL